MSCLPLSGEFSNENSSYLAKLSNWFIWALHILSLIKLVHSNRHQFITYSGLQSLQSYFSLHHPQRGLATRQDTNTLSLPYIPAIISQMMRTGCTAEIYIPPIIDTVLKSWLSVLLRYRISLLGEKYCCQLLYSSLNCLFKYSTYITIPKVCGPAPSPGFENIKRLLLSFCRDVKPRECNPNVSESRKNGSSVVVGCSDQWTGWQIRLGSKSLFIISATPRGSATGLGLGWNVKRYCRSGICLFMQLSNLNCWNWITYPG